MRKVEYRTVANQGSAEGTVPYRRSGSISAGGVPSLSYIDEDSKSQQ